MQEIYVACNRKEKFSPVTFQTSRMVTGKRREGGRGSFSSAAPVGYKPTGAAEQKRIWYTLLQPSVVECLALRPYSACVFCFVLICVKDGARS